MNHNQLTIQDYRAKVRQIFDNLDVSEASRQDYQYRIGLFLDYIQQHGFNHNSFLEYKRYLGGRMDYSVASKNKYLITAKIFLNELNRTGLLPANITQNVKSFSHSKKHKRDGLSDEEMCRLTAYLQQLPVSPQSARLKAIISLLALQGLRQIEASRLDVKDLDLVSRTAMVQGKG